MYDQCYKQLYFIVYDGVGNSVFLSQVITPLVEMLSKNINLEITLISFEKKQLTTEILATLVPAHDRLHMVILYKQPYWGRFSLLPSVCQLLKMLENNPCQHIMTRGPLAGWIALQAIQKLAQKFPNRFRDDSPEKASIITIQARGLCAEEYRYAHEKQKSSWLKQWWYRYIKNSFHAIEHDVYRSRLSTDYPQDISIEAVSEALKDYLITNFNADPIKISLATRDIPHHIDSRQVAIWKEGVRKELSIPLDAYVYCYDGSYKPWQCIDHVLTFFTDEYTKNPKAFLLILSKDKELFFQAVKQNHVPLERCLIIHIEPHHLYRYLSAADVGVLFREKDVVNWVSRPTKMLEYQAVGLKIIHNNTVAWLVESEKT